MDYNRYCMGKFYSGYIRGISVQVDVYCNFNQFTCISLDSWFKFFGKLLKKVFIYFEKGASLKKEKRHVSAYKRLQTLPTDNKKVKFKNNKNAIKIWISNI